MSREHNRCVRIEARIAPDALAFVAGKPREDAKPATKRKDAGEP